MASELPQQVWTEPLAVGAVGYVIGKLHQESATLMLARQTPGVDYFLCSQSFSEVQNAKASFEALARRWRTELRQRRYATGLLNWSTNSAHPSLEYQRCLSAAIGDLQQAISEIEWTGPELVPGPHSKLLRAIHREGIPAPGVS